MDATAQYTIGAGILCQDQECGHLDRVVIDPVSRKLTHLVVDPGDGAKRLVPVDLVDENAGSTISGDAKVIRLRCTVARFAELESAQETEFLPGSRNELGYESDEQFAWPYFPLAVGGVGMGGPVLQAGGEPQVVTYDRIPAGEVDLRRGDRVHATDGEIGRVQGLVIDPADHGVTHVLLQEGHLWGKKTVAIPIRAVTHVGGALHVQLSKAELGDLPPVDLDTSS